MLQLDVKRDRDGSENSEFFWTSVFSCSIKLSCCTLATEATAALFQPTASSVSSDALLSSFLLTFPHKHTRSS